METMSTEVILAFWNTIRIFIVGIQPVFCVSCPRGQRTSFTLPLIA